MPGVKFMSHVVSIALCLIFFFVSMSESGQSEKLTESNFSSSSGSDESKSDSQNQSKRKCSRTELTEGQLILLRYAYQDKPGMEKEGMKVLADYAALDYQTVKNWFNKNRAKIKKEGGLAYSDQEKILKPVMPFLQIAKTSVVSSKKRGRPRMFSLAQLSILELAFKKQKFLNLERLSQVSCESGLSHKQVNVWFQNKRYKRKKEYLGQREDESKKVFKEKIQPTFPLWNVPCIGGNIDPNPPGYLIYCAPKGADGSGRSTVSCQ